MNRFMIAQIHAKAVLPALLVIAEGSIADRPDAAMAIQMGSFSESEVMSPLPMEETETRPTRAYTEESKEWTQAMAKRFGELAKKEALDTIALNEVQELEQLTRDRRNLKYPRPAEEVLWEANQRQVTANLVQALKDYVELHKLPRCARSSAV
jgi:hypothetical protein